MSKGPRGHAHPDRTGGYLWLSKRPLHILVFLLPLVIAYEAGSIVYLSGTDGRTIETIGARGMVAAFFESFGVASIYLPGIALVVVLLIWHLLERDRWAVRGRVLLGMPFESALWALPLLVLGLLIAPQPAPAMPGDPHSLSLGARLTLSVGAGIYEELVFRLIVIAAVHLVAVDLLRLKPALGWAIAIVLSSAWFAWYHDIAPGGNLDLGLAAFYFAAGVYLAVLFVVRGFGIVVAVHAIYDIVVLTVLSGPRS